MLDEKKTPALLLSIGAICGAILFGLLATDFFDANRREVGFPSDINEGWAALLGSFISGIVAFALFFAQRREDRKTFLRHIIDEHNEVRSTFSQIFSGAKMYEERLKPIIELVNRVTHPEYEVTTKTALEFTKLGLSTDYLLNSALFLAKSSSDYIQEIKILNEKVEKIGAQSFTPLAWITAKKIGENALRLEKNQQQICESLATSLTPPIASNVKSVSNLIINGRMIASIIRFDCQMVVDELEKLAKERLP